VVLAYPEGVAGKGGGRVTPSKKQVAADAAASTASGRRRGARVPARAESARSAKGGSSARSAAGSATEPTAASKGKRRQLLTPAAAPATAAVAEPTTDDPPDDGITWAPKDVLVWVLVQFGVLALILPVLWLFAARAFGYELGWPTGPGATAGEVVGRLGVGQAPALTKTFADVSIELQTLMQVPLWLVMLAGPMVVAARKGNGWIADFKVRMVPTDVPLGLGIGIAAQLVLVPVLYKLLFVFIGDQDVSAAARELTDKATSPLGVLMLFVIVGLGAPVCEEVFYRGLVLRSFNRRWSSTVAIVGSSLLFGLFHFQVLQFPALVVFGLVLGYLTLRLDRLGPAIWAHVGFNLSASVVLVTNVTWFG
jgi:membrane protease YdiL (CAAX protease family)